MAAFSQKGLEKYQAEREAAIAEANGDSYQLAECYQRYANADANQHNLMTAYQRAEQAAQQQQMAPKPVSEGEQLQKDIWTQIATGNPQVDQFLTNRWKVAEAVTKGQLSHEQADRLVNNNPPGRFQRRQGGN
jgi:hypothetical protein